MPSGPASAMSSSAALLARVAACAAAVPRGARYLITDFDGTCTITDTTPLVPQLAARTSSTPELVLSRFGELEDMYLDMLSKCKVEFIDSGSSTTQNSDDSLPSLSSETGYDAAGLDTALAAMDAVSDEVTLLLSKSGILAGIDAAGVAGALDEWTAAPEPPVRPPALRGGCTAALAAAAAEGWHLGVLTLNWCAPVVHAYLPVLNAANARVWSNSIDAAGIVHTPVNGAAAKRAIITQLVSEARESAAATAAAADEPVPPMVIYVGDSATDLPAMLAADVGILIGESQSTRELARRYGLRIEPLPVATADVDAAPAACDGRGGGGGGGSGAVIWEASSWAEICQCLQIPSGQQ